MKPEFKSSKLRTVLTIKIYSTETNEEEKGWDNPRVTRILTHDFPQYFAVISRIRQEVHAIGPEGRCGTLLTSIIQFIYKKEQTL